MELIESNEPIDCEKREVPILVRYIKDRIEKKNKNFVILFVGATGSGKSYAALRLAQTIDPTFDISRVCFKAIDFMDAVNKLVEESNQGVNIKGKVVMWDELGVEHSAKSFMTTSNRVINSFFQTSRHLNLICIMTVPLLSFIDSSTRKLMHAVGEMTGINTGKQTSTVKMKMIQANVMTGKEYPKYLRYKKDNKVHKLKTIRFPLPTKELIEPYERKKTEYTTGLNKEIRAKLAKTYEKEHKDDKKLTEKQIRVVELLKTNSVEKVAEALDISIGVAYDHKKAIEKKGVSFKPIWMDKHITGHIIEGFQAN